jgi:class 3 adenylate cyclase
MVTSGPAVHRTIIAVDIEGFGDPARTLPHQLGVRAGLYQVVEQSLRAAGVPWQECHIEDRGDAVFILVPPDIPKEPLVDLAPQALARAVRSHNYTSNARQRIRLRIAVHAGEVAFDNHGATSTSVTTTFRLLDAPPLKHALRESSGVVALIVSDRVFDEVVRQSAVLQATTFRPVRVAVKETHATAWIALPDEPYPADATVLDQTTANPSHPGAATDPGSDTASDGIGGPATNQTGDRGLIIHGGVTGSGPGVTIGAVIGDHTAIGPPDPHAPTRNQG